MRFENGWTVSVQWHSGAYCDNHLYLVDPKEELKECATAEIAAWDSNGEWYQFENDTVEGHKTPDQAADFIQMIKSL